MKDLFQDAKWKYKLFLCSVKFNSTLRETLRRPKIHFSENLRQLSNQSDDLTSNVNDNFLKRESDFTEYTVNRAKMRKLFVAKKKKK